MTAVVISTYDTITHAVNKHNKTDVLAGEIADQGGKENLNAAGEHKEKHKRARAHLDLHCRLVLGEHFHFELVLVVADSNKSLELLILSNV